MLIVKCSVKDLSSFDQVVNCHAEIPDGLVHDKQEFVRGCSQYADEPPRTVETAVAGTDTAAHGLCTAAAADRSVAAASAVCDFSIARTPWRF